MFARLVRVRCALIAAPRVNGRSLYGPLSFHLLILFFVWFLLSPRASSVLALFCERFCFRPLPSTLSPFVPSGCGLAQFPFAVYFYISYLLLFWPFLPDDLFFTLYLDDLPLEKLAGASSASLSLTPALLGCLPFVC